MRVNRGNRWACRGGIIQLIRVCSDAYNIRGRAYNQGNILSFGREEGVRQGGGCSRLIVREGGQEEAGGVKRAQMEG